MSSVCGTCETAIDRRKSPSISCAGSCNKPYHATCVGFPPDSLKFMKTPGLHWYCQHCNKIKDKYESIITNLLEAKINDVLKDVQLIFSDVKHEIMKLAEQKLSDITSLSLSQNSLPNGPNKPLFSEVTSRESMVVIKPKNSDQSNGQTKTDIMKTLNPLDLNIQVSKVKNVKSGGILIGCNKPDDAHKLKQMAEEKLSSEYKIREVKNNNPKLKLVGMIEEYTEDQLLKFIKTQNKVLSENSECRIVKIWPTKKNVHLYQAIVELDSDTFRKVMTQGNLFVNYDACTVYDATDLKICFKCSGFNHFQNKCKSTKFVCPKCSLDHSIKDCASDAAPKCANCLNAKLTDYNHFVWDSVKCTVYQKKLEHYKHSLFSNK